MKKSAIITLRCGAEQKQKNREARATAGAINLRVYPGQNTPCFKKEHKQKKDGRN